MFARVLKFPTVFIFNAANNKRYEPINILVLFIIHIHKNADYGKPI